MRVFILAGGQGTRLRPVWDGPKCMAPVNGKPFLDYQVKWIAKWGRGRPILCLGYLSELVTGRKEPKSIEAEPLGTMGAVKLALLKYPAADRVVVLNGDTYCDCDLWRMVGFHVCNNGSLTKAVFKGVDAGVYILEDWVYNQLHDTGDLAEFARTEVSSLDYEVDYFLDIGTPEGYERAQKELQ